MPLQKLRKVFIFLKWPKGVINIHVSQLRDLLKKVTWITSIFYKYLAAWNTLQVLFFLSFNHITWQLDFIMFRIQGKTRSSQQHHYWGVCPSNIMFIGHKGLLEIQLSMLLAGIKWSRIIVLHWLSAGACCTTKDYSSGSHQLSTLYLKSIGNKIYLLSFPLVVMTINFFVYCCHCICSRKRFL